MHSTVLVRSAYLRILEREPDADGLAHYTQMLEAGRATPDEVLRSIAESPEAREKESRANDDCADGPTRLELSSRYTLPPTDTLNARPNLAVLCNGFNSMVDLAATLRDALVTKTERLGARDAWDFWVYNWRADAAATGLVPIPKTSHELHAVTHGQFIAKTILDRIAAFPQAYRHVHLVAHSLGGRVIESAAIVLSQAPRFRQGHATIHMTFLDAYTPHGWERVFGRHAAFAEHYYEVDSFTPFTQSLIASAANVDVSALLPPIDDDLSFIDEHKLRHQWPSDYYLGTITGDIPRNSEHGFPLARESGVDGWPRRDHPPGKVTRLAENNSVEEVALVFQSYPVYFFSTQDCKSLPAPHRFSLSSALVSLHSRGVRFRGE